MNLTSRVARGPAWEPALLIVACVLPTAGALVYFGLLEGSRWAGAAYGVSKTVQFLLPLLVLRPLLEQRIGRRRWSRGRSLRVGAASALALAGSLFLLWFLLFEGTVREEALLPSVASRMKDFGVVEPLPYLLLAVFISLVHSGLEEYYWRWFLFGRLEPRLGPGPAAVLSSLAFAAHHVVVIAAFARLLPGTLWMVAAASVGVTVAGLHWADLYRRSGSLLAPWVSHIGPDIAIMTLGAWLYWG